MVETADGMRNFEKWIALIICLFFIATLITALNQTNALAEETTTDAKIPTEMVILRSDIINTDAIEEIWTILREEYTETATAAIIGNFAYESGLFPYRIEGYGIKESAKNSKFITASRDKFIYTYSAYGLAGWTGTTNHIRLWDWCEEHGYAVDSIEGQVRFLMADYPLMAEASSIRLNHYEPEDIVSATEDFRQSYEKSHYSESSQVGRARYAKSVYANWGNEKYYDTVLTAPYHFDIYIKVNALNEVLGLKRKGMA